MGKTEIIILIVLVLFIATFGIIYLDNSKKIKANKDKKPEDKPKDESDKAENKQPEISKKEVKTIMEDVSNKSENYIKNLLMQDDENANVNKSSDVTFKEVSNNEIMQDLTNDIENEDKAIVLGKKKQQVHVLEDVENDNNFHENSSSILSQLDIPHNENLSNEKIQIENFEEDSEVGEEFKNVSNKMKIMMMSNALGKIDDKDENRD